MPKAVCPTCNLFFRPKRIGTWIEEGKPHGEPVIEDGWSSYKLWPGDLYECPGCGVQIIIGFQAQPAREHYMIDYQALRQQLIDGGKLEHFIKDCI
jgi:hypothetical protein